MNEKKSEVPIREKANLTLDEAAVYFINSIERKAFEERFLSLINNNKNLRQK